MTLASVILSDSQSFARDGTTVHLVQVLLGDELELIDVKRPYKQTQLSDSVSIVNITECSKYCSN